MSRNRISRENDANGEWYQTYIAEYLANRLGEIATVKKHGVDVTCGDLRVEVKGTKNLFYSKKGGYYHVRGWKADQTACPESITHFVFVLIEEHMCDVPLIYVVAIKDIRKQFAKYPNSQWVSFRLPWVWDHYIFELSYIPTGERFER